MMNGIGTMARHSVLLGQQVAQGCARSRVRGIELDGVAVMGMSRQGTPGTQANNIYFFAVHHAEQQVR